MKVPKLIVSTSAALCAFAFVASTAVAAPVELNNAQLDNVVAGAITTTQTNGGGNTPMGTANGVPTVSTNPAGSAPPGRNK